MVGITLISNLPSHIEDVIEKRSQNASICKERPNKLLKIIHFGGLLPWNTALNIKKKEINIQKITI